MQNKFILVVVYRKTYSICNRIKKGECRGVKNVTINFRLPFLFSICVQNKKKDPRTYILSRRGRPREGLQISPVITNFLYFPVSFTDISMGNYIILNNTTVEKDIFVGIGRILKTTSHNFFFFEK